MRNFYPTVPAFATSGTLTKADLQPVASGTPAGDVPVWFGRVESMLDALETFLDGYETPTRTGTMGINRLAAEGFLSVDTYTLPVKDISPVTFSISPVGESRDNSGVGPGWYFSKEVGTVELNTTNRPVNWVVVDTFGEGSIRLRTGGYDSGWLPSSWSREIHFPTSASLITIDVTNDLSLKGFSNIGLGLAQYSPTKEYITQVGAAKIEEEVVPKGTKVDIQWGATETGPWESFPPSEIEEYGVSLTASTVMLVGSNLSASLSSIPTLPMGTELWIGQNGYLFECLLNRSVSDLVPQANSAQAWDSLPQAHIYRGICSATSSLNDGVRMRMVEVPEGTRWHMSWVFYSPLDVSLSMELKGETYVASSAETVTYYGSSAGDDMLFSFYINNGRVTVGNPTNISIPRGVSKFDIYGEVKADTQPGDQYSLHVGLIPATIDTIGVTRWYATTAPFVETYSQPARHHNNGLESPTFHITEGEMITTVNAKPSRIVECGWNGPDFTLGSNGVVHNPTIAAQALLRLPNLSKTYAKIGLWGGDTTPVVRKSVRK